MSFLDRSTTTMPHPALFRHRAPFPRRVVLWGVLSVLALATGCSQQPPPVAKQFGSQTGNITNQQVRNVLLISIDTLRADHLGSYGYSKPTSPNIDAVARDGVLFERAQATNPITLPSHASILTGTLPLVHGVRDNYDYKLADSETTLAELFQTSGFQTAAFVASFPLAKKFGLGQGFDVYNDTYVRRRPGSTPEFLERPASTVTNSAAAWLEQHHAEPFFLFVHYFDPHAPYRAPEEFAERFSGDPYAAEIAYTDDQLGLLLEKLSALGHYDDTLIVITSDHGESLGEHDEETHSFFIYQSTAHVPLIMRVPGQAAGVRIAEPVSIIDIAPTILAISDMEVPARMQGIDLNSFPAGDLAITAERPIYMESLVPTTFGCSPLRSLVRDRWQYIWTAKPELYDIEADPEQQNNLFDDEAQIAGEMHVALLEALTEGARLAAHTTDGSTQVLDDQDRAHLQTLGYVGGGGVQDVVELDAAMRDPKDFIKLYQGIMRAEGFIGIGRYDEATRLCEMLIESDPHIFRVHQLLAKLANLDKRSDDAIRHFNDAIDAAEKNRSSAQDPDTRVQFDVAETYISLGELLFHRSEFEQATETFRRGLQVFPTHVRIHSQYGGVLLEIAKRTDLAEEKSRQIEEARGILNRAIEIEPENADAHANLGYSYLLTNDFVLAKQHVNKAIRFSPNHPAAREVLRLIRLNDTSIPARPEQETARPEQTIRHQEPR